MCVFLFRSFFNTKVDIGRLFVKFKKHQLHGTETYCSGLITQCSSVCGGFDSDHFGVIHLAHRNYVLIKSIKSIRTLTTLLYIIRLLLSNLYFYFSPNTVLSSFKYTVPLSITGRTGLHTYC